MKEEKKYKLVKKDYTKYGYHTLYRIKALKDFGDVKKGDIGGYVESEDNLSHEGNCWIYGNAKVFGEAKVYDNVKIYGNAKIYDKTNIHEYAHIYGEAKVYNNAKIYGNAKIYDKANIHEYAHIYGDAMIYGNADIFGNAKIYGDTRVYGNAIVCDSAEMCGDIHIKSNGYISSTDDYLVLGPIGSRYDYTTFYLDKDRNIWVTCGCFNDTIEKFKKKVLEEYKDNKYAKQYLESIKYAIRYFKINKKKK